MRKKMYTREMIKLFVELKLYLIKYGFTILGLKNSRYPEEFLALKERSYWRGPNEVVRVTVGYNGAILISWNGEFGYSFANMIKKEFNGTNLHFRLQEGERVNIYNYLDYDLCVKFYKNVYPEDWKDILTAPDDKEITVMWGVYAHNCYIRNEVTISKAYKKDGQWYFADPKNFIQLKNGELITTCREPIAWRPSTS